MSPVDVAAAAQDLEEREKDLEEREILLIEGQTTLKIEQDKHKTERNVTKAEAEKIGIYREEEEESQIAQGVRILELEINLKRVEGAWEEELSHVARLENDVARLENELIDGVGSWKEKCKHMEADAKKQLTKLSELEVAAYESETLLGLELEKRKGLERRLNEADKNSNRVQMAMEEASAVDKAEDEEVV